ncbi:MAG: TIGR03936 family radical SAM-associated protein [Lachnospiraceae bacterium]|nr:TIGR03936 family radical SAM-associated protein [Lachnospiraceae bacterium]
MIFRIRFSKYGVVKFIGHLDVMRYFQKAVRRSLLPIKYSQGFNPHQLMVFASPLGVGITSDGEYMDIETEDTDSDGNPMTEKRVNEMLSLSLTEGFEIVSCVKIPWAEGTKHPENAMALVNGADYMVSLKDGYSLGILNDNRDSLSELFNEFKSLPEITVNKKTKSGERLMDIKPYIYQAEFTDNGHCPGQFEPVGIVHADTYEPGIRFFFRLSAGSAVNIKPEPVIEAFLQYANVDYNPLAFQIHRMQMYKDIDNVVSL